MNVYALIVTCVEDVGPVEIFDDNGVYYGLTEMRNNQRWKMGNAGSKTCLGYFCSRADALRIQECLRNDYHLVNGLVTLDVVEYNMDVLERYQTVQIELDKFYSESCVNGDCEKFSVDDAIRFLSEGQ